MGDLKLSNVRFSYLSVFKPRVQTNDDGEETAKYQGTFLFEKDGPDHKNAIAAIEAAAKEKWGEKAPGILKQLYAQNRVCLKDGDLQLDADGEIKPGNEGMWFIRSSLGAVGSDGSPVAPPRVYNRFGAKITAETRGQFTGELRGPNSGDYGQALVNIWAQDNPDPKIGRRINATLVGVVFKKEGEPFGHRERSDEQVEREFDFDEAPSELGD